MEKQFIEPPCINVEIVANSSGDEGMVEVGYSLSVGQGVVQGSFANASTVIRGDSTPATRTSFGVGGIGRQ